ncbi:hypothetical protein [Nocardia sp. NPDC052316]|uniref:hypothetical protein n=1 Tax=Nocardia sp. NPDC052316 TaxID=3364329 RepID=UPI0037CAB8D9
MSTIPPLTLTTMWGSVSRTGRWQVPDSISVTSTMGSVLLDFTAADCPHRQVEVRVSCQAGKVTLIVPADWAVDANELAANGAGVTVAGEHRGDPGRPLLQVTGRVVWGGVLITDPQGARSLDEGELRRRERHRDRRH